MSMFFVYRDEIRIGATVTTSSNRLGTVLGFRSEYLPPEEQTQDGDELMARIYLIGFEGPYGVEVTEEWPEEWVTETTILDLMASV